MKKKYQLLLLICCCSLVSNLTAQNSGTPGQATLTRTVSFQDAIRLSQDQPPVQEERKSYEGKEEEHIIRAEDLPVPDRALQNVQSFDMPAPEQHALSRVGPSPQPNITFEGLRQPSTGGFPPDVSADASNDYLFTALNTGVLVQDKTGTDLGAASLKAFFGYAVSDDVFDPKVFFDPYINRWVAVACIYRRSDRSGFVIGMSHTANPGGNWTVYEFDADNTDAYWFDHPRIGFNKNWVVVTGNLFSTSDDVFYGSQIYAINKSQLAAGVNVDYTFFLIPDEGTLSPARTYNNSISSIYLLKAHNPNFQGNGFLKYYQVSGSPSSALIDNGTFVGINQTWASGGVDALQAGSAQRIDVGDHRMQDVVYRNGSLWAAHTVYLPANNPNRTAVQWWEVNPTSGSYVQFGRFDGLSSNTFYGYPSIAVNAAEDAMIGFSYFSSTIFASAGYAYRYNTDPPNTFNTGLLYKAGENSYYVPDGRDRNRWGDYSTTTVDPEGSFWTLQEYAASPSNTWSTYWAKVNVDEEPASSYCQAAGNSTQDEWIDRVQINSINNNSGNNNGYRDYTNISTTLEKEKLYAVNLTPAYSADLYNEYWRIWIDLNQDEDFDDNNELVYDALLPSAATIRGTFSIPQSATNGSTRMRIAMKYIGDGDDNAPDPCTVFNFGEVEDYTVNITNPTGSAAYCNTHAVNSTYEWIERVQLNTINNTSGNDNGYGNFAGTSTSLNAGSDYSLTFTPGFMGGPYEERWRAWIDFNRDNDFNDSGELVYDSNSAETGPVSGNISIPANISSGNTRMRVSMKFVDADSDPAPPATCSLFGFGEVEDYTVNLVSCSAPSPLTVSPAGNIDLCQGQSEVLTASNVCSGCTVNWSNGMSGNSIAVSQPGTYTATATNNCGSSSVSNSAVVQTTAPPAPPTVSPAGNIDLCQGQSQVLSATNVCSGCTVSWSNGMAGSSITVTQTGTYTATVTGPCGTSVASNTAIVQTAAQPSPPTVSPAGNIEICQGQSQVLSATNVCSGCTVSWSNGMAGSSITVTQTGTYTATVTGPCGTSVASNTAIVQTAAQPSPPTVSPAGNIEICQGQSQVLSATNVCSGCTVSWSNGMAGSSITVTQTGTYTATVTGPCGTSVASNTAIVQTAAQPSPPTVSPAGNIEICQGQSQVLSATNVCSGCTVSWSNGMAGSSITVTQTGTYTATVTGPCGTSVASNTAIVQTAAQPSPPTVSPAGNIEICQGQSQVLSATNVCSGCTVSWSNGMAGSSITVTQTGTYTATVTGPCGTSVASNTAIVQTAAQPSPPTVSPAGNIEICQGQSQVLSATNVCSGCTVSWSNGMAGSSITVTQTGTYTATVTGPCGTSVASNTAIVQTAAQPSPPTVSPAGNIEICQGQSQVLSATNVCSGCTVSWSNGMAGSSITVSQPGTYTAILSNQCGSSASSNAAVVQSIESPSPPTIFPSGPIELCEGQAVILNATNICSGCSIIWNNGTTASTLEINTPGFYSAVATNSCGESNASQPVVVEEVLYIPTVELQNECFLAAPQGSNYQWYLNGNPISGATGQFWTAVENGFYTVSMADPEGCMGISDPIFANCTTGLSTIEGLSRYKVHPNPSSDVVYFTLELEEALSIQIDLLSIDGKVLGNVLSTKLMPGSTTATYPVSGLAAGVYLYRIRAKTGTATGRLAVVH